LSNRLPCATYTSHPRIGFSPDRGRGRETRPTRTCCPCSVTASAGIFSFDGFVEQFVDAAGAVEQRELGVQMEVNEVHHSHSMVDGGFDEMS
jgi:hypothetical protein